MQTNYNIHSYLSKRNIKELDSKSLHIYRVIIISLTPQRYLSIAVVNQTNKLRGLSPQANYTDRPPPVGEVSANFLQIEGCCAVGVADPLQP
jgi:hypothetical protein